MLTRRLLSLPLIGIALMWGLACSGADRCVPVDTECQPLYEPTFANIFQNTLAPSCGVAGVACHAPEGAAGGLVFADIEQAHAQLVGADGRIVPADDPGNIGCGSLLSRLGSDDPGYQMPPFAPLPEAELCAIRQWVVAGAPR